MNIQTKEFTAQVHLDNGEVVTITYSSDYCKGMDIDFSMKSVIVNHVKHVLWHGRDIAVFFDPNKDHFPDMFMAAVENNAESQWEELIPKT